MSSTDLAPPQLAPGERAALLEIARASIQHGLTTARPLVVPAAHINGRLAARLASFVTVYCGAQLRGCAGNLEGKRPLATAVARNAYHAASLDPRFQALGEAELPDTTIEVSVLSATRPIDCGSEPELVECLVPHEDGLVLSSDDARATFLPKVWEHLPTPAAFIGELKRKAGLPVDFWSENLRFDRYRVVSFSDA